MLDACLSAVRKHSLPDVKYRPAGILPSEMLAFIALCREQGVTTVVESGRRLGYSTTVLAKAGFDVFSVELEPLKDVDEELLKFPNVHLVIGDGVHAVPSLIRRRCAVLLDGPKGLRALQLWTSVKDKAVLGAIHDASKNTAAGKNEARPVMENAGAWFTDDWQYVAETGHLDEPAWRADYSSRAEMTAHGFTLAIFKGGMWI